MPRKLEKQELPPHTPRSPKLFHYNIKSLPVVAVSRVSFHSRRPPRGLYSFKRTRLPNLAFLKKGEGAEFPLRPGSSPAFGAGGGGGSGPGAGRRAGRPRWRSAAAEPERLACRRCAAALPYGVKEEKREGGRAPASDT